MPSQLELANKIEDLEALLRWIEAQTADTQLPKVDCQIAKRVVLGCTLLQHTHITSYGLLMLLKGEVVGPAFTLARPLLEAFVKAIWTLECATVEQLTNIYERIRPFPKIERASMAVQSLSRRHGSFVKAATKKLHILHAWTHGEVDHLIHLFDGHNICPMYPIADQLDLLESFVSPLLRLSAAELIIRLGISKCTVD